MENVSVVCTCGTTIVGTDILEVQNLISKVENQDNRSGDRWRLRANLVLTETSASWPS